MNSGEGIEHLLLRYLQGQTTDEENTRIKQWAMETPENREILKRLQNKDILCEDLQALFQLVDSPEREYRIAHMEKKIQHSINQDNRPYYQRSYPANRTSYIAAAIILFLVATGVGIYYQQRASSMLENPVELTEDSPVDIQPGGNRAKLTLASGQHIDLSEFQEGIKFGNSIHYLDGSPVDTESLYNLQTKEAEPLVLSTPRGGTYQLTLADGTNVWLNSSSKLAYPSRFDSNVRMVELEGEAFFEVAAQAKNENAIKVPFKVVSKGQIIEVLGTQFNVSAYNDEPSVKTTLVEGTVRLLQSENNNKEMLLEPDEQGILQDDIFSKQQVDIKPFIAWKNGQFLFNRTSLEDVMKQVGRWYDIEVVYTGSIPQESFSGKVNRHVTLMGLLEILQLSSINVKLEGRKLIVH